MSFFIYMEAFEFHIKRGGAESYGSHFLRSLGLLGW
jgi:hypothetical protein